MAEERIRTRAEDGIYYVGLNRPEKRNAITLEMLAEFPKAITAAEGMPDVRAILVYGEGRGFSSGIDFESLGDLAAFGSDEKVDGGLARHFRSVAYRNQTLLSSVEACELPVVGAIHGFCIGLGLELALLCDLLVASEETFFALPEGTLGLVTDCGGATRLSRRVTPGHAKELLFTGKRVSAARAAEIGIVNHVVPAGEHVKKAVEIINEMRNVSPLAVGLYKRIVDQGRHLSREDQLGLEAWAQSMMLKSEDFKEGVRSKLERRPPKWQAK
ncbi:MAG: enoyl-CoA hydratase/isomerase family protein [Vicinamibacteria bacterium]